MRRRDFVDPRQVAHAAGQFLGSIGCLPENHSSPGAADQSALLRLARRCMATTFEVVLPFGTSDARAVGLEVFDLLDRLESQLTVYRDSSEVSHLNRLAPFQAVRLEEGLFALLELAASLHRTTRGAFDVTAGALIKSWGFFRGPRRVPGDLERNQALAKVGMQHVVLDAVERTVRYLRPGLEINLGSIGKGYALDRVAAYLRSQSKLPAVLLQGGSSSVYATGTPPSDRRGWAIDLRHPWIADRVLGRIWLKDQGLGTSAATFQYLEHAGRKLGHVLDPRTGWPASGVASASVVAPTAAEADALSTAFFVGGPDLAREICSGRPEIGAVILPDGDDAETIVLNLPRDSFVYSAAAPACPSGDLAEFGLPSCHTDSRS